MKNQTKGGAAKVLRRNPDPIDIGQFQTAINAVVGKWKIEMYQSISRPQPSESTFPTSCGPRA